MEIFWISFLVVAASFAAMAVGGLWGRPFLARGCARRDALGAEDPRCGSCSRASSRLRRTP
jgi:hypothetical protein